MNYIWTTFLTLIFIEHALSKTNLQQIVTSEKTVCFRQDCKWNHNKLIEIKEFWSISHQINVIDIRNPSQIKAGMIKGTLSIYPCKSFEKWIIKIIKIDQPLVVYGHKASNITQVIELLRKIGYQKILGYSVFSIQNWIDSNFLYFTPKLVDTVFIDGRIVLDVRTRQEWMKGIVDTKNIVLYDLQKVLFQTQMEHSSKKISKQQNYVIHCHSGFRAMIAYSFLLNLGYDVVVFPYAFDKIQRVRIPQMSQLF